MNGKGAGAAGYFELPPDHEPGMEVPEGGSMCANCKYLGDDKKTCTEENFIAWNGSDEIPAKITAYCSDWWKPSKTKPLGRDEARGMTFREVLDSARPALAEGKDFNS